MSPTNSEGAFFDIMRQKFIERTVDKIEMPAIIDSGVRSRSFLSLLKAPIKFAVLSPLRKLKKFLRLTLNTKCRYKFHDRRKNSSTLIIILAGYKPFLWDDVFARISAFAPADSDVCIISSGKYDDTLAGIAEKNAWSYLSIKRNCVQLAQNKAILLHPSAEFIYKIDEDIFTTKNSFSVMMNTYRKVIADGIYEPGFVAPLLPINAYGHVRVLAKLGLSKVYEEKFDKAGYFRVRTHMIDTNPEAAKFFWGKGGFVPLIDEMDERFYSDELEYRACPIRFSIGFILFRRETWQKMGMFTVPFKGAGMGNDEVQICSRAMSSSEAVIVAENTAAGHLSFGPQNAAMKEYYLQNREKFRLPEK